MLILLVDDLGIDKVGAYGFLGADGEPLAARTPNIDRLARKGIRFRNFWAAPSCSTCRAELLTGTYPSRTGIGNLIDAQTPGIIGLRDDVQTMADILPPTYAAGIVGKWHLAGVGDIGTLGAGIDHAPRCGFDLHFGSGGNLGPEEDGYFNWSRILSLLTNLPASQSVPLANEYASTRSTSDALRIIDAFGERPFLLWVSYNAPHKPLHIPPAELFSGEGLDLTSELGKGKAMIEALDMEIGRLLAEIPPEVMARTTVFFLSDNGAYRGLAEPPWDRQRQKGTVYNGGVNVPLIVSSPRIPLELQGSESQRLVDATDLLPTVADLLGASIPQAVDGRSFARYFTDSGAQAHRPWIFAERFKPNFVPGPGLGFPQVQLEVHHQAVRGERYKLVRKRSFTVGGQLLVESLEMFDVLEDYFELQDLLDPADDPPAELQTEFDQLLAVLVGLAS